MNNILFMCDTHLNYESINGRYARTCQLGVKFSAQEEKQIEMYIVMYSWKLTF